MKRRVGGTRPDAKRILVPFLHFHGIASLGMMSTMVYSGSVYVNPFKHKALERSELFDVLKHANVDAAFFSPALIEDLASHPESARYLKPLNDIVYGGASLNHVAGDYISKYTYLRSQWGVTESLKVVDLETCPEDYDYCAFDLASSGLEFRPVYDNIHEMILHRNPASDPYVALWHRKPDATEWHVGDLWTPHPDPRKSKYVWKFFGRTDDLISFQDGRKFHPTAYELKHSEHSLIRAACIAGTGHSQAVLVLELVDPETANSPSKKTAVVDSLWEESISPVNTEVPRHGQIAKTHIVVGIFKKPFERNVKGTVARKASLRKYEAEIEEVYREYGDGEVGYDI